MRTQLTIVESELEPVLVAAGLKEYEDYVSCETGELVAESNSTRSRRLHLQGAGRQETCYLKVYRYPRPSANWAIRTDKATIEARNCRLLRERCRVRAPEVIAHGVRRRGWRVVDAFIMTRAVPGAEPLDAYARRCWPDAAVAEGDGFREELLLESAKLVSRMHRTGFSHIDLQWRNILVVEDAAGGNRLCLIDSARGGLRWHPLMREHGRLRDLSSLFKEAQWRLTARERVRWLRSYFGVDRLLPSHHAVAEMILRDRESKDGGTAA